MNFRLDVYIHNVAAEQDVVDRVTALEKRVETMSQVEQQLKDAVAKINDETTKIGNRLDQLAQQIANGVTAEVGASIAQQLNAIGDQLEVMAQDPNNPVPNPTP